MENFENFFTYLTQGGVDDYPTFKYLLIDLFLLVTFGMSIYDKATDWSGNLAWLKSHFAKTILKNSIPKLLLAIVIMEVLVSLFCVFGVLEISIFNTLFATKIGCGLAALTLIVLLAGQRMAKDYAGAFTLTGYFIIAMIGLI